MDKHTPAIHAQTCAGTASVSRLCTRVPTDVDRFSGTRLVYRRPRCTRTTFTHASSCGNSMVEAIGAG
eukprot:9466654-Pyramimonas_sp.AAC.1